MKHLIMIGGPMGVGKTTVSKLLYGSIHNCAFLDGDWVFNMSPFVINEETKNMVHDNIKTVISNYFLAGYENVIFTWVMHKQEIIDRIVNDVMDRLAEKIDICSITLISDEKTLRDRLEERSFEAEGEFEDYYEKALDRMRSCMHVNSIKLDTNKQTPAEVKNMILDICKLH